MTVINSFTGDYAFLSNFHVEKDGKTVEHRFQAAKTKSAYEKSLIMKAQNPGAAKKLGRTVTLRPDWEQVKVAIMVNLVREKFTDPELAALLRATGDATLIEGNLWNDRFWGVDRRTGYGKNVLGHTLMLVRAAL
ncbi:NADAR family protein [Agromyces humi]|uniref:NADAR family protein n=1 Tax=Agromyces humi TaxID=1766800 RepID=UPI001358F019|nr:NADAR family protein [Agromyces humi]